MRKKTKGVVVVIYERRSGSREVLIRNASTSYTLEVRDAGKSTEVIEFADLGKAVTACSKKLRQGSRNRSIT
jgi:hypothetical protein